MGNGRVVFILGAGASCPYGYPAGVRLRELICHSDGFIKEYNDYLGKNPTAQKNKPDIIQFKNTFFESGITSIDLFMSKNPKLASIGKYIIAFEIFRSERESCFAEKAKWEQERWERTRSTEDSRARKYYEGRARFVGGDWYSYIYNRFLEERSGEDGLPDFTGDRLAFITFNYDRSFEQFLYQSLRNSFAEIPEERIVQSLSQLKILHAYGQIMPLKWQDPQQGVDYKPQKMCESLLRMAADNVKTIYEQKVGAEIREARELIAMAQRIFFLGFGYARENMEILGLSTSISPDCQVYGTAYGLIEEERQRKCGSVHNPRKVHKNMTKIEPGDVDCLMLLRKHL